MRYTYEWMNAETFLNQFAIRCFRDTGDGDYIAARLSYRAGLMAQYLWSSEQAIEKYLKCILLLNRIKALNVGHDLEAALKRVEAGGIALNLTGPSKEFISHLNSCAQCRYLETSWFAFGRQIVEFDRAVWELRRFCTLDESPRQISLRDGHPAPKIAIPGGLLESIVDNPQHPAREPLLWQNGFFGKRIRRRVRAWKGFSFINSPLFLNPEFVDAVAEFVFLPDTLKKAYREEARRRNAE